MAITVPVAGQPVSVENFGKPVADAINTLQASEIFYSQITANVPVTATTAATANMIINPGFITYDGSRIMLEFFTLNMQTPNNAVGASILATLWDSNTELGFLAQLISPAASTFGCTIVARIRLTPTAGQHNYNIRAWLGNGTTGAQVTAGPGGGPNQLPPAYLRATRA